MLLALWLPEFITGQSAMAEGDAKGSTIGGVEVGDLKGQELKDALTEAVNTWSSQPVIVSDGGSTLTLNSASFQFDIDGTVEEYEKNYRKSWYEFWDKGSVVHLPLQVSPSESVKNEIDKMATWDSDKTYDKVTVNASYLKKGEIEAEIKDLSVVETDRVALSVEEIPTTALGVKELSSLLHDKVINPGETFSMLEEIDPYIDAANSDAVNFVASMLYHAALHTHTEIAERHSQKEIPSYLQPGIEANIDALAKRDLKFTNLSSHPMKLKLTIEGNELKVEMYTSHKDTEVSLKVSRDESIAPRTITRYSNDLRIGQSKELEKGAEGLRVTVYRTIQGEERLISRDYYPPVNRVVLKSSRQPVVPVNPDTTNDSDLGMDLDGDGVPDDNSSTEKPNGQGSQTDTNEDGEEKLPPGSYYDKGGNLITP